MYPYHSIAFCKPSRAQPASIEPGTLEHSTKTRYTTQKANQVRLSLRIGGQLSREWWRWFCFMWSSFLHFFVLFISFFVHLCCLGEFLSRTSIANCFVSLSESIIHSNFQRVVLFHTSSSHYTLLQILARTSRPTSLLNHHIPSSPATNHGSNQIFDTMRPSTTTTLLRGNNSGDYNTSLLKTCDQPSSLTISNNFASRLRPTIEFLPTTGHYLQRIEYFVLS